MGILDSFFGGAERDAGQAESERIGQGISRIERLTGQSAADFQDFIGSGEDALARERDFLGLNGREAEQTAINNFIESPGQAFLRKRAERALLRNSAATGGLRGGNVLRALNEQAVGIAAGQLDQRKDRISRVANRGLSAVANLGALRGNAGANIGSLFARRGAAEGRGIRGEAAGMRSGLARVAGAFL